MISCIFVTWWQMAFALGINISCGRLGSVINNVMSPHIAAVTGSVDAAFWAGAIVCGCSLVCCFLLYLSDRSASAQPEADKATSRYSTSHHTFLHASIEIFHLTHQFSKHRSMNM